MASVTCPHCDSWREITTDGVSACAICGAPAQSVQAYVIEDLNQAAEAYFHEAQSGEHDPLLQSLGREPRPLYWRLDGKTPVPAQHFTDWFSRTEDRGAQVADTTIWRGRWRHTCRVSTVFLAVDLTPLAPLPSLFETVLFWQGWATVQWRYATWEEAHACHARLCDLVSKGHIRRPWFRVRAMTRSARGTASTSLACLRSYRASLRARIQAWRHQWSGYYQRWRSRCE
jgi:hypothetical protein